VVTLQKMHGTAWKLVGDYVAENTPTWDMTPSKTAQGLIGLAVLNKIIELFDKSEVYNKHKKSMCDITHTF